MSCALTPARQALLNLPTQEGWKAELTLVLVIYWDGLPVRRQSPVLVVNHLIATQLGVRLSTFWSFQHHNHYVTKLIDDDGEWVRE